MGLFVRFAVPLAVAALVGSVGKANAYVVLDLHDDFALAGEGLVTSATGTLDSGTPSQISTTPYVGDYYVDFGHYTGTVTKTYHYQTAVTYDVSAPGASFDGDGPDTATVSGVVFFSATPATFVSTDEPILTFSTSDSGENFSFAATSISGSVTTSHGATYYNIVELGTLSGTGSDPSDTIADAPASLSWTFTSSTGGSYNGGGSISDPPVNAPEPASLAMLGVSLLGLAAARRRA